MAFTIREAHDTASPVLVGPEQGTKAYMHQTTVSSLMPRICGIHDICNLWVKRKRPTYIVADNIVRLVGIFGVQISRDFLYFIGERRVHSIK